MHTDDVISLNGSSRPIPRVIERESWAAIHRLTEMRALGAKIGVANDGKEVQVQRGSNSRIYLTPMAARLSVLPAACEELRPGSQGLPGEREGGLAGGSSWSGRPACPGLGGSWSGRHVLRQQPALSE